MESVLISFCYNKAWKKKKEGATSLSESRYRATAEYSSLLLAPSRAAAWGENKGVKSLLAD